MSQSRNTFTSWAVLASGEGGGRIASQFFARAENPGIDDRILVMNTNRADIRNTIERIEERMRANGYEDEGWDQYALEFGSIPGAGNLFTGGEEAAREDLSRIVGKINNRLGGSDAFLHMATLGGGTGNGSVPYLVSQFKSGLPDDLRERWMDSVIHTTFGVWPYYYEAPQRHFNAVCGLSRLLRQADGSQNADMVLLASNSHLDEESEAEGDSDEFEVVNERIINAVDLMIGAGRETHGVIDVQDYVAIPSQLGAYHFTPAVALDQDADIFELEYILETAAKNAYVPLDVGTSRVAYAIVRAPESLIESGELTEPDVNRAFRNWKEDNGLLGASGMVTLTPKQEPGSSVDVLLLLGGFGLGPLLDHSWDEYEAYKENIQSARSIGTTSLTAGDIQRIEDNLTEYRTLNEE